MASERDEFEAAMAKEGYHLNPQTYRDGTYRDSEYAAGWAMWQAGRAAQAAAVLAGWKVARRGGGVSLTSPDGTRWNFGGAIPYDSGPTAHIRKFLLALAAAAGDAKPATQGEKT